MYFFTLIRHVTECARLCTRTESCLALNVYNTNANSLLCELGSDFNSTDAASSSDTVFLCEYVSKVFK